ncbi:MAG: 2-oxoacid:acceptor oxidoreductase subunit alpha [Bacillota bacterium]|nr:2-oxoacid:acceptor oxidoreductase subunit alpha [Bacillota bacterium]
MRIEFWQGNEAILEGALAAGARLFAGYPITPSSEIAELASLRLPAVGGVYLQMEDEIGSMAALVGASLAGARAFTATSGPGFSLMQENLGLAIALEIPCVVVDIQRSGPSTGLATRPAQADLMQARWGTHGDHPAVALAPATVQDCYDLTVRAFHLADLLRHPVILLGDEVIAHARERVVVPEPGAGRGDGGAAGGQGPGVGGRPEPDCPPEEYLPFGPGPDGVAPLARFGSRYVFHVSSSMHDETGFPNSRPENAARVIARLHEKITRHAGDLELYRTYHCGGARYLVVAYGAAARAARAAVDEARAAGVPAGLFVPLVVWPFPAAALRRAAAEAGRVLVAEMSHGQLALEVERILRGEVVGIHRYDGEMLTPEEVLAGLEGGTAR